MENIFLIITSPVFILVLKIIFLSVSAFILAGIIILFIRTNWAENRFYENVSEFTTSRAFATRKSFKQWSKVSKKLDTGNESDYKVALVEADTLLGDVLKKMGYKGETMREILDQIDKKTLPNIEEVWKAHKLRNEIVHSPDYKLRLDQAKKNFQIYEQAFRDLEMF